MDYIDEPFAYTTLYAFECLLCFTQQRYIDVNNLFAARQVLEEQAYIDGISFKKINQVKELNDFVLKYKDIVMIKNGILYLHPYVNVSILETLIMQIEKPYLVDIGVNFFRVLNITEPIDFLNSFYQHERSLENIYQANNSCDDSLEIFKLREQFIELLKTKSYDYLTGIEKIQNQIIEQKREDYIYFPINKVSYINSGYYDERYNLIDLLDEPLCRAIFSKEPLFYDKVKFIIDEIIDEIDINEINSELQYNALKSDDMIDDIYCEYDEESEIDDDYYEFDELSQSDIGNSINPIIYQNEEEVSRLFGYEYIHSIKKLKEDFGKLSTFETIINRINYLVSDKNSIVNENSEEEEIINLVKEKQYDFSYHFLLASYFVQEIFTNYYDELFIQKLIYIKTYYTLTKDKNILDSIDCYKNNFNYQGIKDIVVGNSKNKTKKL